MLPAHLKTLAVGFLTLALASQSGGAEPASWPEKGSYRFDQWAGPALGVHFSVPPNAVRNTPILVVVPGAQRDAKAYRDDWHPLAVARPFIVLAIEASQASFPTEFDYNAGGVTTRRGAARPEAEWLYSAVEPLFDDFKLRFGSQRRRYSIYGHSAGGQFVHTFLLFRPEARVARAVAANPAFFMMPESEAAYPFGVNGAPIAAGAIKHWLASSVVLALGDRDLDPRTLPLSNGSLARAQGPHVLARGLRFYHEMLVTAAERGVPLAWRLDVLHDVGHSNKQVAPHVVKYLFPEAPDAKAPK